MTMKLTRSWRLLAFIPAVVAVGSVALDFALLDFYGAAAPLLLSLLAYVGVGLMLVLRLPRQPIGWLLLAAGALLQLATASVGYAWAVFVRSPGTLPLGEVALLIGYAWMPGLGCLFLAISLFPTGRLPSRRWYLPAALMVLVNTLLLLEAWLGEPDLLVTQTFAGGPGAAPITVPNPLAVDGTLGNLLRYVSSLPLTFVVYLVPVAAVLSRFRTAAGAERQQLKWFAYASSTAMLFFVVAGVLPIFSALAGLGPAVAIIALDLIPISVAIAILRYRLYDIDRLINRTFAYAVTTGAIGLVFFAGVVVLPSLLRPLISSSEVAVAVSTLVCFALFQPLRTRIQDAVDRRFDRSRYDAARTLDAFSVRLRDEVDLDSVRGELLDAVGATLSPTHASVWLRERVR